MAELVDAPASGAGDRKVVEVRVLFWAPFFLCGDSAKARKSNFLLRALFNAFSGVVAAQLRRCVDGCEPRWPRVVGALESSPGWDAQGVLTPHVLADKSGLNLCG